MMTDAEFEKWWEQNGLIARGVLLADGIKEYIYCAWLNGKHEGYIVGYRKGYDDAVEDEDDNGHS